MNAVKRHQFTHPRIKIGTVNTLATDYPTLALLRPFLPYSAQEQTSAAMNIDQVHRHWYRSASNVCQLTSPEQADILVLPVNWFWVRRYNWRSPVNKPLAQALTQLHEEWKAYDKPTLALFSGDRSAEPLPFEPTWVARESCYHTRMGATDLPLAPLTDDLFTAASELLAQGKVLPRPNEHNPRATIGFCGLARPISLKNRFSELAYHLSQATKHQQLDVSPYYGETLRHYAIDLLSNSKRIDSHFIMRPRNLYIGNNNVEQRQRLRTEYIANLLSCDYALCIRGPGNFSYRFYEALSLGKVPVLIDTDTRLPFEDRIPWEQHILRVPVTDLGRLDVIVQQHYERHTPASFNKLLLSNRQLWLDWFRPETYYPHLLNTLLQREGTPKKPINANQQAPLVVSF
ncbi:MAG: exostosin domain-containing protein [Pontibacterium sp.]